MLIYSLGGSNIGVMKHVGEAISSTSLDPDNKPVVIGITNWATVSNNHDLFKRKVIFLE